MNSKQLTILYTPLNTPGHINGASGLLERIVELTNCRVVVLTVGKIQSSRIKDKNYEFIDIDASLNEEKNIICDEYEWKQTNIFDKVVELVNVSRNVSPVEHCSIIMRLVHGQCKKEAVCLNDEYYRIIKELKPNLIITDYITPPLAILYQTEIPWVYFISCNPLPMMKSKLESGIHPLMFCGSQLMNKQSRLKLQESHPEQWLNILNSWDQDRRKLFELYPPSASVYNQFCKQNGYPEAPVDYLPPRSPYMNVYMYPKCLDYKIQDDDILSMPDSWTNCEIALHKSSLEATDECKLIWQNKIKELRSKSIANQTKPLIYFSLGSLASADRNLIKRYLDILSNDEKNLYIVSKGVHGNSLSLNDMNMIGDNYIPQLFLLQLVDLAIVHGGNNTFLECLYIGVPFIVMPVFSDQSDNAQRLVDMNLGIRLDIFKTESTTLFSAIETTLNNEELKLKLKNIANSLQASTECDNVARQIVKLMSKEVD